MNSFQGQSILANEQEQRSAKLPIYEFLLGYGRILPSQNLLSSRDLEENASILGSTTISYLLRTVGRVSVGCIGTLSSHLEFDEATKTLLVFHYPSFCTACLSELTENARLAVINACAGPPGNPLNWLTEEVVSNFLREILPFYRLLFGQHKESRKAFRSLRPFQDLEPCL
ncbi:hypothetical protein EJ08DRAFT_710121 [Tothia fuscella]|uniref:Uncharacterized protein n=1 Tax=Tothia fuscella TaxID=1048955 RepID=A0A9P4NDP6_9PEZI|nr:hypothetical protein EJ08DRAFT_710121 [Tothia fuscella]